MGAALKHCRTTPSCWGVYDNGCDGIGDIDICTGDNPGNDAQNLPTLAFASDLKSSSQGSCVYEKIEPWRDIQPPSQWYLYIQRYCKDELVLKVQDGSFEEAQRSCLQLGSECGGVYDRECDGVGPFQLCKHFTYDDLSKYSQTS